MPYIRLLTQLSTVGVVALILAISATSAPTTQNRGNSNAQDERNPNQLPTNVQVPDDRNLLSEPPFDRMTLIDGTVIEVDPVSPRPLPTIEELEEARVTEAKTEQVGGGIFVRKGPEVKEDPKELTLVIRVHDDEEPADYSVRYVDIERVDYFEDILLADALEHARLGQFDQAFERIFAVETREPDWRGLPATINRVLLQEGQQAIARGDVDGGLRILGQLRERSPDEPGLRDLLVKTFTGRIESAIQAGSFAVGRRRLADLEELAPESTEVRRLSARFEAEANRMSERAESAVGADRVVQLGEAVRIWPRDSSLVERYQTTFKESPVLDVAVLDVPRRPGPYVECSADDRVIQLLYHPILRDTSQEAVTGERDGQLTAKLEITDIGRRLLLQLNPGVLWNDESRTVGAADVARALSDRALPSSPGFDARWANLLDRITTVGDLEVEVYLNRAPINPETWLVLPVGPAHSSGDGLVWSPNGPKALGSGSFELTELTETVAQYDRAQVSGEDSEDLNVARIREQRLPTFESSLAMLRRRDLVLIEEIPPSMVPELTEESGLNVGRYEQPQLHWIALDGRNPVLRNRSVQRALSFAIDRELLLRETILRGPIEGSNGLIDGPVPTGSFADAPDVEPLVADLGLAKARVRAAITEMNIERIALTFEYPATPVARLVAPKLAKAFEEVGFVIEAVERPLSDLETELGDGRRFDLAYRTGQIDNPLMQIGPTLCPGYPAPEGTDALGALASTRILQLLLRLEQIQDLPTARSLLVQIDRECRDELPIIPLWQLETYYAWNDRLSGIGAQSNSLYEGIESWTIEPWSAPESR